MIGHAESWFVPSTCTHQGPEFQGKLRLRMLPLCQVEEPLSSFNTCRLVVKDSPEVVEKAVEGGGLLSTSLPDRGSPFQCPARQARNDGRDLHMVRHLRLVCKIQGALEQESLDAIIPLQELNEVHPSGLGIPQGG